MNNLVWFGNNLRVADNQSLIQACHGTRVIGVFCFDPRWQSEGEFGFPRMGPYRARFLIETVEELQKNLRDLNITLLVLTERPEIAIPDIIEEFNIDTVYLQNEWTRDEKQVIDGVRNNVQRPVHFTAYYDQFLYHPEDIPFKGYGSIPDIFTHFRKRCKQQIKVRTCLHRPDPMPIRNLLKILTPVPSLPALGYSSFEADPRSAFPFQGGEGAALIRIQDYFWSSRKLAQYKKTRNGLSGTAYSSKLSAWLANGSISARTIYSEVKRFEKEICKNQSTYWIIFELIWRDYFKYVSLKHGSAIFKPGGILNRQNTWENKLSALKSWVSGTTPEPFVNANMKELAHTGWMSNRGRQNVASYWSKQLKQDWRTGAAYFEYMLIDYDVHSNWGNWMYNSGVGNDPRDRTFNIKGQAERYDPLGDYQRLWLEESLFQNREICPLNDDTQ